MSYKAAVITVVGECGPDSRADACGDAVAEMLTGAGFDLVYRGTVRSRRSEIAAELSGCVEDGADIVITTGGTGFSPDDVTPEATRDVIDREVPSIPQAMLFYSLGITPRAMLSRAAAGIHGRSLIINLPGSEKAARENLGAVIGTLEHAMRMING